MHSPSTAYFFLPPCKASALFSRNMKRSALVVICIILNLLFAQQTVVLADQNPITINFDDLLAGTIVTNQYPVARFSSDANDVIATYSHIYYGSSRPNWISGRTNYYPYDSNYYAPLVVDFTIPVNNLKFNMLAADNNGPSAYIDIYQNGTFTATRVLNGSGTPFVPVLLDFAANGFNNITRIVIYNITDPNGLGYDDFTFTPNLNVSITNPRVSGNIGGTTENALVGIDIPLQASPNPSNLTGGTYSWTFSGPYSVTGGSMSSSSVTIRSLQPGTILATATYTLNGFSVSSTVTINAIVPTLTSFTARSNVDQVTRDQHCSVLPNVNGARYSLGCYQVNGGPDDGIIFTAQAQIPSVQFLTDPSQSGIKIKQFISLFRKRVHDSYNGNFECMTVRSPQDQVDTGWQLDGTEAMTSFIHTPPTFAQGNTLTYTAFDAPSDNLDSTYLGYTMKDVLFVDDRFQTYVYYFVGDPLNPIYQQPLKLATENTYKYSYIGWKWNGQANFGSSDAVKYYLKFSNTPTAFLAGTNNLPTLHGNGNDTVYTGCLGDPPPSTNRIDGAQCFVLQQYWDFLNRAPDQSGWDFWTSRIAQCEFDRNCIQGYRSSVAQSFFNSAEFITTDPAMANPPGSPNFDPMVYNPAFVRHCFQNFLRRDGDQPGIAFWTDVLNRTSDYLGVINSFITSDEYRSRTGPTAFHPCP